MVGNLESLKFEGSSVKAERTSNFSVPTSAFHYNSSDMERTLAIIKPDAVAARYAGKILQRIEDAGFQIRAMRLVSLTKKEAEGFYDVHRARPFFESLTTFMSSGPAIVLALEAADAIKKWRTLM